MNELSPHGNLGEEKNAIVATTKQFRKSHLARCVIPCSLEDEEFSLRELRRLAASALPYNYRLDDRDVIDAASSVTDEILSDPDLSATTWQNYYRRFVKHLKAEHKWQLALVETHHAENGLKHCEFSAPSPGLTIDCELPQSGIVGWGFVYFLQDNSRNSADLKIGYAVRDPVKRARTLLTGTTGDLCMVAILNAPASFEKLLHRRYKRDRRRGEWFSYGCGWDEFHGDHYERNELRDEILRGALSSFPLSKVFSAEEYRGWLFHIGELGWQKEILTPR